MPLSVTERFARTYTPRVPDDSYDSLGGADILDTVIKAPFEKPFEQVRITSSLSTGALVQTLLPSGQVTRINLNTGFTSGAIRTSTIPAPVQPDRFQLTTSMAGGTLH